ncbi:MAG: 1-acyl-sn-glycerol-3-phosphate acyltransferase [Tannerella sp.]|jgi:putative hemolysin|nr:1-acyl-sn-glycerol-3-phosphate acyltransferase [Tannerella sp.]
MAEKKLIDVREVLRRKAPDLAKRIPAFVVNYLCRLVHEDELNAILERYGTLEGVAFMQALVREFDVKLELTGVEHLPPPERRNVFVSNHPLGGLDGICLAAVLGEHYGANLFYLVNDLLLHIPNLQSIFVPVNKHGAQSRQAAMQMEEAFRSDRQILTFPAGLCSRRLNGQIRDLEWKKTFIRKAVEYRRDVVPLCFEGCNSGFFYRLANIRKRSGIKMNIEMLYLPDEMFKSKHRTFRIHTGKPVPWQTFDRSKRPDEWAEWVREKVYLLSGNK